MKNKFDDKKYNAEYIYQESLQKKDHHNILLLEWTFDKILSLKDKGKTSCENIFLDYDGICEEDNVEYIIEILRKKNYIIQFHDEIDEIAISWNLPNTVVWSVAEAKQKS